MKHELKSWPGNIELIVSSAKKHEVRKNDRNFKTGDHLYLREWDPASKRYTGNEIVVTVTHVTEGGNYGLPQDLCVMSIYCNVLVC